MRFEWGPKKTAVNLKNTAFHSKRLLQSSETRWQSRSKTLIIQRVKKGNLPLASHYKRRLIVVSHTQRDDLTRIISARPMKRKERVIYEEG